MKLPVLLLGVSLLLAAADFPEIPPYVLPPARMAVPDDQDAMGARLFRTTSLRRQTSLDGWWDFVPDPADRGEQARYFEHFPMPETVLWVPGTWNSQPRYWQYSGAGWYRRSFETGETGNVRISFGGIFYKAKIWLDGAPLCEHDLSYLPISLFVPNLARGTHTLVVRADNRLDETTLPKRNVDWFPFGGIDRPVYLEAVPDVYVERFQIKTPDTSGRIIAVAELRNSGKPVRERVSLSVDGQELRAEAREIPAGASLLEFEATVPNPRVWTADQPNLYSARLTTGRDDQYTRFGIRQVGVSRNRIVWNGAPVKLRGVNRHEDHPDWGSAVPAHLVRSDIEIIKRLGANAVRSHYPPSELLLDYCDQSGLMFLDEVPSWQYRPEQLARPAIQEKIKRGFRGMVERDQGHASILTWSLGNEWPDPDKSYDVIKGLVDYARSVDRSHPITFVTGGPTPWRVHELLDVIAVNWAQYQWYEPATFLDEGEGRKSIAELNKIHDRYPDKPVMITEFGGAESQIGWHNWGGVKWSEEYQGRNVQDSGRYALETDWISGGCVWQFCDTRTAPDRILAGRLHGWNAKGIVDAQRNPKMAYYLLQELFRKFK